MREIPDNKSTRYKTICDAKIGCINVSQFENSKSISSRMYHYLYLFSNAEYILENNQPNHLSCKIPCNQRKLMLSFGHRETFIFMLNNTFLVIFIICHEKHTWTWYKQWLFFDSNRKMTFNSLK